MEKLSAGGTTRPTHTLGVCVCVCVCEPGGGSGLSFCRFLSSWSLCKLLGWNLDGCVTQTPGMKADGRKAGKHHTGAPPHPQKSSQKLPYRHLRLLMQHPGLGRTCVDRHHLPVHSRLSWCWRRLLYLLRDLMTPTAGSSRRSTAPLLGEELVRPWFWCRGPGMLLYAATSR